MTTSSDDIHILPINDIKPHIETGTDCPCEPEIKVEGATLIIIHNAYDHREIIEQAIDIMNGVD